MFASKGRRRTDAAPLTEVGSTWHRVGPWKMHARRSVTAPTSPFPPVVLVHGQVVSSRYMMPLVERLGVHFPVHAPDLPGFGQSSKPRHVLTIRELADALAGWMDAAGIRQAVLLGNSLGCQIAVECALRHPEKVIALILQGPTLEPRLRGGVRALALLVVNTFREESVGIGPFLDYYQAGLRRAALTGRYLLQDRLEEKLPQVRVPTLVVRGAKDVIVSQEWAERVTALLPDGTLRVVPGAAHTMVALASLELTRLARPFIHSLDERNSKKQGAA